MRAVSCGLKTDGASEMRLVGGRWEGVWDVVAKGVLAPGV